MGGNLIKTSHWDLLTIFRLIKVILVTPALMPAATESTMCSPDPRTSDPVCDSCDEPAMSGRLRCGPCQARMHFDCDEPREVESLVADGFLTRDEADQIGRECIEYVTWAREQNAAARSA